MRSSTWAFAAALGLTTFGVAEAHHSAVMFDHSRVVVVQGVVKTFEFGVPHSWVAIVAQSPNRRPMEWDLEGEDSARLARDGLNRETLKPGDRITVGVYQLHDGRPIGQLLYVTAADGKTYGRFPM